MVAEIINVGSEILLGDILNTNANYLCKSLSSLGIDVYTVVCVGDNETRLKNAIFAALTRSDIIFLTGGLGPTKDDITKEVLANLIKRPLVQSEVVKRQIELKFEHINGEIPQNNYKQSMVISGAEIFYNENGTAPGMAIEYENKIIILLPGPPNELIPLFNSSVVSYLSKFKSYVIHSKNVNIFGLPESRVDELISDILDSKNPTVGIYASAAQVRLRVTAKASNKSICIYMIDAVIDKIKERLKGYVYGVDVLNMENALVDAFKFKNKTLAVAESCTGGLISSSIVNVAGSSECFKMGVVCYSNYAKQKILGIKKDILNKYGAVSFIVAKNMAQSVRKLSKSHIGISTTGVAGPGGGSILKPVGLVYIGISSENKTKVYKLLISKSEENYRNKIRLKAALFAMNKARQEVLGEKI